MVIAAAVTTGLASLGEASEPSERNYEDGALALKPRPYKRAAVDSVVIETNGAKALSDKGMPDDCSRFIVTKAQIKQYFGRARPVSRQDYIHELEWSPCVATGQLNLADGRSARWSVQQYGLGTLYIDRRTHYFHCANCSLVNLVPEIPAR